MIITQGGEIYIRAVYKRKACTRAKYRIAFIGNLNDWKNRIYFREFIPKFIDSIDA